MPDTEPEDDYNAIVARLKELSPGTEIRWTQHHADCFGVLTGYVDVYAPIISDHTGSNWTWTVELPEMSKGSDDLLEWTIVAKPTHRVFMEWMPGNLDSAQALASCPVGADGTETLSDAVRLAIAEIAEEHEVYPVDGWTFAGISQIVMNWIAKHAGRTDLKVVYDESFDTPMFAKAKERLESTEDCIQLGGGLYVTSGAMDDLLAMHPADAAAVTEAMQAVADQHKGRS